MTDKKQQSEKNNDDDRLIERLWAQGKEEPKMSREAIIRALRPRVAGSTRRLKMYLWLYLAMLLATLVLQGVNIAGYRNNATMLAVHGVVLAVAVGLSAFGIHMFGEVGRLDRMDERLAEAVDRRLSLLRGKYERWLWACALSAWMLAWAITTLVDNAGGVYRINKPLVFVGTSAAMLIVVYGSTKVAHQLVVRDLRAVLEDLEGQILDHTAAVDQTARSWRWKSVVLGVVLFLLALLGLWLAL